MNTKEKQWKCVCNKEAEEFSLCDNCEVKNKLTAFLEENASTECGECECGVLVREHNSRIVNFVLDIVEEEMWKKEMKETVPHTDGTVQEFETGYVDLDDIKQILTKIKSTL